MEEIITKRIILLTNAIIILSGIGFIALIHRVDAIYKSKEYTAINRLRNCIEELPEDANSQQTLLKSVHSWLKKEQPAVFSSHHAAADSLASVLWRNGFKTQVREFKLSGNTESKRKPGGFMLIETTPGDTAGLLHHPLGSLDETNRLKHFAEQYKYLFSKIKLSIATGFDEQALIRAMQANGLLTKEKQERNYPAIAYEEPAVADSSSRDYRYPRESMHEAISTYSGYDQPSFELTSVTLRNDSCEIIFKSLSTVYQEDHDKVVRFPVQTIKADGPELFVLFGLDEKNRGLNDLTELNKLVVHYGDLPMGKAMDMIGNDYMEAYENVDVFGFSFSTTSLPLALLCFFFFLSIGLYLMIRQGEKLRLKVISETNVEDITDFFVKRPMVRMVLWLILPLAALAATLPSLPVENEKLIVLGSGALLLGSVNLISLMKARKL